MRQETRAIHTDAIHRQPCGAVTPPVHLASTFVFEKFGRRGEYAYSRVGNPTRSALEASLASLESGASALATASGMAAITTAMFLFKAGDHVIAGNDIYGGTYRLFNAILPNLGITFSFIDMRDPQIVRDAIRPNTRGIWIETPSNPLLNIVDLAAVVGIAREHHLLTLADNTFMSPIFQKPLDLGVDVVVHSTTKYLNGHSDVVGGAVIARDATLGERLRHLGEALGTVEPAFDAYLVLRGIKTLAVRMDAHQRNAAAIARWLEKHPRIKRVYYPGLETHPQRALIESQMNGSGGMVSFDLDADDAAVPHFFEGLQLFQLAMSLGGVESLIEQPWSMSHATMGEHGLASSGITPQTVRASIGLESVEDLIEDLDHGLAAM